MTTLAGKLMSFFDFSILSREMLDDERQERKLRNKPEREDISTIVLSHLSTPDILRDLEAYGVFMVEEASRYPRYATSQFTSSYYDCRDWAFDMLGFPSLTFREGYNVADELLFGDILDISYSPVPQKGGIVMYFDPSLSDNAVKHWGIISKTGRETRVMSKWGPGNVYDHSLDILPHFYGNRVYFFRVS